MRYAFPSWSLLWDGCSIILTDPLTLFAQVLVSEEESGRGLLLHPPEMPVTVKDAPIQSGLEFTQFTATVSGSVSCIGVEFLQYKYFIKLQFLLLFFCTLREEVGTVDLH